MKANLDKFHLLTSGKNFLTMNVNGFKIEKIGCEKLLGIKANYQLKFKN